MSDQANRVKHEGGCLCGRTRFTIFAEPHFASYCHCHDCREASGAPVSAFIGFPTSALVWQGEPLSEFQSSKTVVRTFCPECGTSVSYADEKLPEFVYLYVGVMDEPERYPMESHSHIGSKLPWLHIDDDLPTIDGTAAPRS